MRRCLSLFMVLLLALRGLLGDAVAMELMPVAPPINGHTQHANPSTFDNAHTLHHRTADTDSSPAKVYCATDTTPDPCSHGTDGGRCSSCAMCHSALGLITSPNLSAPLDHAGPPTAFVDVLASAPARNLIKPPIV